MTIHIEDLTLNVIIGLLDFERDKPQRVIINLECTYEYTDNNFIDYAHIVELIEHKLHQERYLLLENALLGLKETIYKTFPQLFSLHIKISKPDILDNSVVSLSQTWTFS